MGVVKKNYGLKIKGDFNAPVRQSRFENIVSDLDLEDL